MLQRCLQQRLVAVAEILEPALKAALEAPQKGLRPGSAMFVPAHDVHHQRRDQRSRKQIAGQHREAHRLGQRHKEEARHARQEEHRHKHNADT